MDEIIGRMEKLSYICNKKRSALADVGIKHSRTGKILHVVAGVLALLSGTSVSAAITKFVQPTSFSVIGAALAFGAGLISLITSSFFDEKEMQRIAEGLAGFATLRESADLESIRPNLNEKQAYEALKSLFARYNELCARYDRLILSAVKTWPSADTNLDLPRPDKGSAYPPPGIRRT
jgi:hypothetical protein